MPGWYFAARRSPLLRHVKQRLPAGLQQAMTARIARGSRRPLPPVDEVLRGALREALAEDAAAFCKLTGQDFAHWSV
jgi:hypothetical protein